VATGRGIDARVVEFVIVLKIPQENFKASNCMALRFMHHEGSAICQVIGLYCNKVVPPIGNVNALRNSHTG
jgi:hypothetical protein